MEIYQLKTFVTVAKLAHLTRAAERLHLTQPAVSKQIKALEEELGVTLFERTPTGVVLTKSGRSLLQLAEQTMESAFDLMREAKRLRTDLVGTIRLGTIIDPEILRLGEFLGLVLRYHPKIDIKLTHGVSGSILERILSENLDAGFYLGKLNQPQIRSIELKTLNYVIAVPPQWHDKIEPHDWKALATLPWVGTPVQSSQHRLVKEMFAEHGLEVSSSIEADQEATMIEMVRQGVGLCMMRDNLAQAAAARGELLIWEGVQRPCLLSFIYPERAASDPVMEALLAILHDMWQPLM